jgi:hypothetical protein
MVVLWVGRMGSLRVEMIVSSLVGKMVAWSVSWKVERWVLGSVVSKVDYLDDELVVMMVGS